MELPVDIASALEPLFKALPPERAMQELVVVRAPQEELVRTVEALLDDRALTGRPELIAGLWLYIDDLDRSHKISQNLDDITGAFWHGIMHRREGDFANSHYWFNRAGRHPAMEHISEYEPHAFVDEVADRYRSAPAELVDWQRREWAALFGWCAGRK